MKTLALQLFHDEVGFIVSAELILVATITVLGLVVGLSEVAHAVNQELEDVASAFGAVNQSYEFSGFSGHKGQTTGSFFDDEKDFCDSQFDIVCDNASYGESGYGYYDRY